MRKFVIISKDALCMDYLPIYGNLQWKTPNIDALARKGTVFKKHYTAAPSTVMSFFSAVTGKFAHETPYQLYERVHDIYQGETFFSKLKDQGFNCHVVWGDIWGVLPEYFDCYRKDVELHVVEGFKQGVGAHYIHDGYLLPDEKKRRMTMKMLMDLVESILLSAEDVFLWIHFPHVINGEVAYGSDIELWDEYIGKIRELVPDECIVLTADHGNMNGLKGKIGYGYDVYNKVINIPLITPRINDIKFYEENTCNVDLYDIIFKKEIVKRKFVYSDSAYRAQKNRKLAIIYKKYKYIYNKKTKVEELYDLEYDPLEQFSLIEDYVFDMDRKVLAPSRELFYYPDWDSLPKIRELMRMEKNKIWKNGDILTVLKSNLKDFIRPIYDNVRKVKSTAVTTKE